MSRKQVLAVTRHVWGAVYSAGSASWAYNLRNPHYPQLMLDMEQEPKASA